MSINQTIQHKRSDTPGSQPSPSLLAVGEIAINFSDRSIYTLTPSNTVIELARDIQVSASQPATALVGTLWYDTNIDQLKSYDGTSWTNVTTSGKEVLSANTTFTGSPGGTGTIANPYTYSVITAPGTSTVIDIITITGLSPGQFVPIVDQNTASNGTRFSASNNFADSTGTLTFSLIFTDTPVSSTTAAYTSNITVGTATIYIAATVSMNVPFPQTVATPIDINSASTVWTSATTTITSTGSLLISTNNSTFNTGPITLSSGNTLYLKWSGGPGTGTGIDSVDGTTITGSLITSGGSSLPKSLLIDKQPDAFQFVDQTGAALSTPITSAGVTITGFNSYVYPTSSGTGTISVASGTFVALPSTPSSSIYVVSGQSIQVRVTSSSTSSTAVNLPVTMGGVSDTFTVTTISAGVNTPSITTPTAGATGISPTATIVSSAYSVTGPVGTHLNSDWEIYNNSSLTGPTVASSLASTTNLTTWTPSGLSYLTQYWARVRYRSNDSTPFVSDWSPSRNWTTVQQPGVTWTNRTGLSSTTWGTATASDVVWNGTRYLTVGPNGKVATSTDGVTWTYQAGLSATAWGTADTAIAVVWNGSQYLVVGELSRVATSPDGVTWTYRAGLSATAWASTMSAYSVVWNGSQYLVTGAAFAVGQNSKIATSPDGITWTNQTGLASTAWGIAAGSGVFSSAWNGSQYLVVGNSGRVATSPDGITWTYQAGLSATAWGTDSATTVVWNGSQYLVTGQNGKVATSPDGVTWTYQAGLSATAWGTSYVNDIVWNGSQYLAVGNDGKAATSPDGVTWTYQAGLSATAWGPTADAQAAAWGGTQYLAVGQTGKVATSP